MAYVVISSPISVLRIHLKSSLNKPIELDFSQPSKMKTINNHYQLIYGSTIYLIFEDIKI